MVANVLPSGRKPRVLVLTSTFPRWQGDTEPRFVLDLCRHLSLFANVLVLAPHTRSAATREVLEGVEVRRFRYFLPAWQGVAYEGGIVARIASNPLRVLQLPLFFCSLAWAVHRINREWGPDVIHAHWIIPQGLVAALGFGKRPPVLCTIHGGDLHGLRSRTFKWLKRRILNRCCRITAVSNSMLAHISELAPDVPVDVIAMGTDLKARFVPPSCPQSRSEHELLFVGRIVEKKGLRYLLDAVAILKGKFPELTLTVAGDGPLTQELANWAKHLGIGENTRFLGGVRHDELAALYQRATLAVFPFVVASDGDQEGFGLVVVEAMGCGCPVVASDLPAIRDSVIPGVTGLLTPPGDVRSLADAIDRCLTDSSLRSALAGSAREAVLEKFDWGAVAERYRRALYTCLD